MEFEETVDSITALEGGVVDVSISGPDQASRSIARMVGILHKVLPPDEPLPPEVAEAVREVAVTFRIGESDRSTVCLWPTRFISGTSLSDEPAIEVTTRDARIVIEPYRPAWG